MVTQQVKSNNKVRSAYEDFLGRFRTAAEDADRPILPNDLPIKFTTTAVQSAEFETCMYLRKWPSRRLGSKRMDIAIKALETFSTVDWSLTKSTVYLNYFLVTGSKAILVQALHFDFVSGGQQCHPFFHVQLSDELIPESDIRTTGIDLEPCLPAEQNHCYVTTRIPTADMTLASVLYCLVADHLAPAIFREFAEKIHSVEDRLPILGFEALRSSLDSSSHFKSSHWFSHMFPMH